MLRMVSWSHSLDFATLPPECTTFLRNSAQNEVGDRDGSAVLHSVTGHAEAREGMRQLTRHNKQATDDKRQRVIPNKKGPMCPRH